MEDLKWPKKRNRDYSLKVGPVGRIETFTHVSEMIDLGRKMLEEKGPKIARKYFNAIFSSILDLNMSAHHTENFKWNPEGKFSQYEFDKLKEEYEKLGQLISGKK